MNRAAFGKEKADGQPYVASRAREYSASVRKSVQDVAIRLSAEGFWSSARSPLSIGLNSQTSCGVVNEHQGTQTEDDWRLPRRNELIGQQTRVLPHKATTGPSGLRIKARLSGFASRPVVTKMSIPSGA